MFIPNQQPYNLVSDRHPVHLLEDSLFIIYPIKIQS